MLTRVRKTVIEQTAFLQVPWDSSSLTGDFYFKPPNPSAKERAAPDLAVWKAIEDSPKLEDFSTFIAQYPDSPLVPFARTRLAALHASAAAGSQATAPQPGSEELKPVIGPTVATALTPPGQPAAVPDHNTRCRNSGRGRPGTRTPPAQTQPVPPEPIRAASRDGGADRGTASRVSSGKSDRRFARSPRIGARPITGRLARDPTGTERRRPPGRTRRRPARPPDPLGGWCMAGSAG